MSNKIYTKIKRQNGERFARILRDFHDGIFEIPAIVNIVKYAGHDPEDAEDIAPYLVSVLTAHQAAQENDEAKPAVPRDPFELLSEAGYDAFHADTLEKQNSIEPYFEKGELLCTFNDNTRYQDYHMVHAVRRGADTLRRADFKGKEKRQDNYGTSVISIQMLKKGGFISIKNRYNHTVAGCDHTFDSNPDNIINGLSDALRDHFKVDFNAAASPLPSNFVLMGEQILKFNQESNNVYYSDQAWAKDGIVHRVNKSNGDALFDRFLFDNKTKKLKLVDPKSKDSFADDFNRDYGENPDLEVREGNLYLGGHLLIGAEKSKITTLDLPGLTAMGDHCLHTMPFLRSFTANVLKTMGSNSLNRAPHLKNFTADKLETMGTSSLCFVESLENLTLSSLKTMGSHCLRSVNFLQNFTANALETMGYGCINSANYLTDVSVNSLKSAGAECFYKTQNLNVFKAPMLKNLGRYCFLEACQLKTFIADALKSMGEECLYFSPHLVHFSAKNLEEMGKHALRRTPSLQHFHAPKVKNLPARFKRLSAHYNRFTSNCRKVLKLAA